MGTQSQPTARATAAYARPPFGAAVTPAPPERRSSRRYSMHMTACCESRSAAGRPLSGAARVVNISSGGLLVYYEHPLEAGSKIRVRIDWPALLNGAVPLALHVDGLAVRAERNYIAVKILKSEFRIRRSQAQSGSVPIR